MPKYKSARYKKNFKQKCDYNYHITCIKLLHQPAPDLHQNAPIRKMIKRLKNCKYYGDIVTMKDVKLKKKN